METPDKNQGDIGPGPLGEGASARFTRIETDTREIRGEISELRREMRAGFENVDAKFVGMDAKFERLMFRLLAFAGATWVTLAGSILAAVLS